MLAALADHLWQFLLFCSLAAWFAWLARGNSALIRLWIWRLCALKLLLPFSLLFALGRWLGLPVRFSDDPVPTLLLRAREMLTPLLAPLQSTDAGLPAASLGALVSLPAIALFLPLLWRGLRVERWLLAQEQARRDADPDDRAAALGFFKAALFTSSAIAIVLGVLLGGAVADRLWRLELLLTHARALRGAAVTLVEAAPGMGTRWRVDAGADGVLIRNVNVQELIGVAYGVSHFAVWTDQMYTRQEDAQRSWWLEPRYDVRIRARLRNAQQFDSFALRERMTQVLAARFGVEIHLNGECQRPCGRWDPLLRGDAGPPGEWSSAPAAFDAGRDPARELLRLAHGLRR
jgi:hypothetical protein